MVNASLTRLCRPGALVTQRPLVGSTWARCVAYLPPMDTTALYIMAAALTYSGFMVFAMRR